ncbi:MAG: MMPL family transporter [Pirellulales bacterium]
MSDHSLLTTPLERLTRVVLRAPHGVLAGSLLLALVAVAGSYGWLGFRTSRLDLLDPNSDYNRRWLDYLDEFGSDDDVLVLVRGSDPAQLTPVLDALTQQLERQPDLFRSVLSRSDLSRLRAKGLHFVPEAELNQLAAYVEQLEPIARGEPGSFRVGAGLAQSLAAHDGDAARARAVAVAWLQSLRAALDGQPASAPLGQELEQLGEKLAAFQPRPLIDGDGTLGLCALRFAPQSQELVPHAAPIARLRQILAELSTQFPEVELGATGMPLLEYDEMSTSQQDMTIASVVSLLGVVVLLVLGYGNLRYALLAVVVLLFGMAWSFGFVTLVIGHLNLLSVSFAVILIGLGIDFGIHYLARFSQLRSEGRDSAAALLETARGIGPGVVTGAVTTACAFFAAGLTDFTGVAELGIIAGGGILVCLLAALVVLPPLVSLLDGWRPVRMDGIALGLEPLLSRCRRRPWLLLVGTAVAVLAAAPGLPRLRYDHNLLNLQPRHIDSVRWEHVLLDESDRSVWFAIAMADDRAEALQLKARFAALPSVERTEEIASLLPETTPAARQQIETLRRRVARLPAQPVLWPALTSVELQEDLARAGPALAAGLGTDRELGSLWGEIQQRLATVPAVECSRRLSHWRQQTATAVWQRLRALSEFTQPEPPELADLDPALTSRFVSRQGKHLLRVYARGSIWDRAELGQFVQDVERVDPRITGHPIQTYYASRQMQLSYVHAAVYAFLAVMIVLMIDFQSLTLSLVAALPLVLGCWLMLGTLGWLDIPLNAANMIVLPLVLGIGVDNGVHVVHDWRSQPRGTFRLRPSVGVAMILCSSTTMVGFCSMIFARHQGLRTLGQVLTLGIACCLATSLGFLPTLLETWDHWRGGTARRSETPDAIPKAGRRAA